jgi:hypothetical protein
MSALTDNRNTREINGRQLETELAIYAAEIMYAGGMAAMDYAKEIYMASDTLGLKVLGRVPLKVDNTADGYTSNIEHGIFRYANSSTYPITSAMIGKTCYVEDDNTVAGDSTYLVPAGLVYDVDSKGVWVDQTVAGLEIARMNARIYISAKTADYTVTAADCFQGNVVITVSKSTGATMTLPTAIAGYRIGFQRITSTSGYDVVLTPASGDKINSGAAAGSATNAVDAVSDILWLETPDVTYWKTANPVAKDRASWVTT